MKPEEQLVALAKWAGWNSLGQDAEMSEWWIDLPREVIPKISYQEVIRLRRREPPDYLSDLNAVHELEKGLIPDKCPQYLQNLGMEGRYSEGGFRAVTATAPQRCEALLRTLGLWRETK